MLLLAAQRNMLKTGPRQPSTTNSLQAESAWREWYLTVAGRAFPEGFCSLDKKASSAERPGAVMENGGSVDYDDHCTVVAVIDEPQKCSFFTSLFIIF